MRFKQTTHSLAALLEELADALRQLPDMPTTELALPQPSKNRGVSPLKNLLRFLPTLSRDEAATCLSYLGQRELIQLCKECNIEAGSKWAKGILAKHILWHLFEAPKEPQHIQASKAATEQPGG